jgi:hypothetical protein
VGVGVGVGVSTLLGTSAATVYRYI